MVTRIDIFDSFYLFLSIHFRSLSLFSSLLNTPVPGHPLFYVTLTGLEKTKRGKSQFKNTYLFVLNDLKETLTSCCKYLNWINCICCDKASMLYMRKDHMNLSIVIIGIMSGTLFETVLNFPTTNNVSHLNLFFSHSFSICLFKEL